MTPNNQSQYLIEVPEYAISKYAEHSGANNAFERLLTSAAIFKEAEMTPIFLYDQEKHSLCVAAKETWGRKLH